MGKVILVWDLFCNLWFFFFNAFKWFWALFSEFGCLHMIWSTIWWILVFSCVSKHYLINFVSLCYLKHYLMNYNVFMWFEALFNMTYVYIGSNLVRLSLDWSGFMPLVLSVWQWVSLLVLFSLFKCISCFNLLKLVAMNTT